MLKNRGAQIVAGVVLLLAFCQFPRGYDLQAYLRDIAASAATSWATHPYPTAPVAQGPFFQSPVVAAFLYPLTLLPLLAAKLVWTGLYTALAWRLLHLLGLGTATLSRALFVALLGTYPLTDVMLSGNMNFLMLAALLFGWHWKDSAKWQLAAPALALACFIKPLAVVFPLWYLLRGEWRFTGVIALWGFGFVIASAAVLGLGNAATWWQGWLHCLQYYPRAAEPDRLFFQSPPAALFRLLEIISPLDFDSRLSAANLLGVCSWFACFFLALRQCGEGARNWLLASIYLATPYSWAGTLLFLFPALVAVISKPTQLGKLDWSLALAFALSQKFFMPLDLWTLLMRNSFHTILLGGLALSLAIHTPRSERR